MAFQGTVKTFRGDKGFGFIIAADGTEVFVHVSACVDQGVPVAGDLMSYDMEESKIKPGQMQATNATGGTGVAGQKGGGKGGPPTGTLQGTCKNFNGDKGFGFITGGDGTDAFLHVKAMVDGSTPQQGDWLTYDMAPSTLKPDQMQASNVTGGTGWGKGGDGGKGGGYGASKGDSWGAPMGGKGSPYGGGGGDSWGKGGGDPWGKGGGDSWGKGGGDPWGKGGGDPWGKGGGDPWGKGGGDPWAKGGGDAWGKGGGDPWGGKGGGGDAWGAAAGW